MLLINNLQISLTLLLIVKILFMIVCIFLTGGLELYKRAAERGPFHILDIPTYTYAEQLVKGSQRVLDLGCSEGLFLSAIDVNFKVGVDIDFPRLFAGRAADPSLNLVCADASALPFKQGSFDCITAIGTLPYFASPLDVLGQMKSLVEADGKVILSTISNYAFYRLINIYRLRHRIHFYSRNELEEMIKLSGLNIETISEKGIFFAPILSSLYSIPSWIDQHFYKSPSSLGQMGRNVRWLTNPIIDWEYSAFKPPGYQWFLVVRKNTYD